MSALWFIGFSLVWTALLAGSAHVLSRDPVPARFAHNLWRGAAALAMLPWVIAAIYAVLPGPYVTPIPDMPYIGSAVEALSNTAPVKAASQAATPEALSMFLWAVLIGGWGLRLGLNVLCQFRLQKIKRDATPAPELSAAIWATRLGLKTPPTISLIADGSPFLAGIKQRTIYIPEAVADPINANVISAHECTHLVRGDLITRPLERFVADLLWFSPFAWVMRRQLDYWREAACDEQTAALTGDNVAYARALATTARLTRPAPRLDLPVAAFILPRNETLKKRLNQLLEDDRKKPRRRLAIAALVAGLILAPMSLAQSASLNQSSIFTHAVIEGHITSGFGQRTNPFTKQPAWHSGVDIKAPKYTHVHAPADAQVLLAKHKEKYGNTVDLLLEDGRKMRFSQLAYIGVEKGEKIKAGHVIGKVGESGTAKGPHLHLEIYVDGEHQDPEQVEGLVICKDKATPEA